MESKPTTKQNVLYPELSYQIMQVMFEVHNQLGPGFSEEIYEKAVVQELKLRNIPFECQKPVQIFYKDIFIGNYRLDLVIDNQVIVEWKAVQALTDEFKQQLLSYLKATGMKLGILVNFGSKRVQATRVVHEYS